MWDDGLFLNEIVVGLLPTIFADGGSNFERDEVGIWLKGKRLIFEVKSEKILYYHR